MLEPDLSYHYLEDLGDICLISWVLITVTSTEGGGLVQRRKGTCLTSQWSMWLTVATAFNICAAQAASPRHYWLKVCTQHGLGFFGWVCSYIFLISQWLSQALQLSTCFQKCGGTVVGLAHCSHKGFCCSISQACSITAVLAQMFLNLPVILKLHLTASCSSHSSF